MAANFLVAGNRAGPGRANQVSRVTLGYSSTPMFAALAREAKWCVGDVDTGELSSIVLAFEKASQSDELLVGALASAAMRHMRDFDLSYEYCTAAWAFAMAGHWDPSLSATLTSLA